MRVLGAVVGNGAAAAPERPNNKKDAAQVLHELNLRNLEDDNRIAGVLRIENEE